MYTSLFLLFSSNTIYVLSVCVFLLMIMVFSELNIKNTKKLADTLIMETLRTDSITDLNEKKSSEIIKKKAPGPKPYPIIGNLAVLSGYEVPYQAFNDLAKKYGSCITLQLGTVPTFVVNGIDNIKEVLIHKGSHFDGRPNFRRYHQLFCGNKENCKYFEIVFQNWSLE